MHAGLPTPSVATNFSDVSRSNSFCDSEYADHVGAVGLSKCLLQPFQEG